MTAIELQQLLLSSFTRLDTLLSAIEYGGEEATNEGDEPMQTLLEEVYNNVRASRERIVCALIEVQNAQLKDTQGDVQ